jgi:hypothetical protein
MAHVRWLVVMLAALLVATVAACGGDDDAAPLTLEQRVLTEVDAPGTEPDPVETRIVARGIENIGDLQDVLIVAGENATAIVERLKEDGFVAGIADTRFYPAEPGAEHEGDESHVGTLVGEFGSDEGAADAVDVLTEDGLQPCPEKCAFDISEFEVDEIPGATGVARVATAESLEETGEPGEPHADYTILFSDGPYAYEVIMFGPPEEVTEEQVEALAQTLYARVQGAPPPQG